MTKLTFKRNHSSHCKLVMSIALWLIITSQLTATSTLATTDDPFWEDPATQHASAAMTWHPFLLQHTTIVAFSQHWKKNVLLQKHEQSTADPDHNTWWVYCDTTRWHALHTLMQAWDQPTPQIAIRAMIMQVDAQTIMALGGLIQAHHHLPHQVEVGPTALAPMHLQIAKLGLQQVLTATLQAATEQGHGHMLASPYLVTRNHHPATIETGAEVPYTEKTIYGDSSVSFKKAVLKLAVTPHVIGQQHILLDITLTQDQINPLQDSQAPSIQTRTIQTQVQLDHEQTLLLGGIEQQNERSNTSASFGLEHVPWLKHLFTLKNHHQRHQQLILLITPSLVGHASQPDTQLPQPFQTSIT